MDKRLHQQLQKDIEELRILVGKCSTETVAGFVASQFLKWPDKDIGLSSPHRQLFYMLGLMLTTQNPTKPEEFDDQRWDQARKLLQNIFSSYAWMYWPTPEEANQIDADWHKAREVAMPAFLHYFNSGLLASTLQVKDRIQRYIIPFDDKVKDLFGITASDIMKITDGIAKRIQDHYDQLIEIGKQEEKDRHEFLNQAERQGWDLHRMRKEAENSKYKESAKAFMEAMQKIFKIDYNYLVNSFGSELAMHFWQQFTAKRGKIKLLTYPTEFNPAIGRPICLLSDSIGIVPSVHSIYIAILDVIENSLTNCCIRDAFLRRRDKELEKEMTGLFAKFCGQQATIMAPAYEDQNQQFEHDAIIIWEKKLFVIEAKASPPREPLRDPSKAFIRIRDDFRADRGIQKAYEQAHRIESAFSIDEAVKIYDKQGRLAYEVSKTNTDRIFCICITRDNYGMLASDLSLLLQKEPSYPYPWAANILDLEALFDTFSYFGWGLARFCEYLEGREKMHGKINASDEMEFVGFLIEHGTFGWLFKEGYDRMALDPSYTDVLNRIHHAKLGGEKVDYKPHAPVTTNLSAEVRKWTKNSKSDLVGENVKNKFSSKKQGRNEPCACGSGKKYKHCCGR